MDEFRDFLALLANALLLLAIPILVAYVGWWMRARINELKQSLTSEQLHTIETIGSLAVQAAEQAGLAGVLSGGAEKKRYATQAAQRYFDQLGIKIDVNSVAALIEAEVINNFSNSAPPVDAPEARAELIDKAVRAAVLAAEQSGLKQRAVAAGLELATQKKEYALELAQKYLKEHGIKVDKSLIDGLIEAQIMRFKIASAGTNL